MVFQEKKERNWSIVVPGILLVLFGVLCAFYPGLTLLSITFVVGVGFVFSGILNIVSYVRERKMQELSGWYVVYGILDIIVGLMFLIHPFATAYVIPWLIGAFVIAYAVVELISLVSLRRALGSLWTLGIVSAVLSIVIGICFFLFPETLVVFIALFAIIRGAMLIVAGWSGYQPI